MELILLGIAYWVYHKTLGFVFFKRDHSNAILEKTDRLLSRIPPELLKQNMILVEFAGEATGRIELAQNRKQVKDIFNKWEKNLNRIIKLELRR